MTVRKLGSLALGLGTAALVLGSVGQSAHAASPQSTFSARYTQNANTEALLLQQAQTAGGSSPAIATYSNTVRSIEGQVGLLYSSEQALSLAKAAIPVQMSDRNKLQTQERTLNHELANAKSRLERAKRDRIAATVRMLELQVKTWTAQLAEIKYELGHPLLDGTWTGHPLGGGLTALQQSILDLQQAAIHYTRLWIAVAKAAPVLGNPASITGLRYASASVLIPTPGSAAATDPVAVKPVVKDARGNVLPDTGAYSVTVPPGAVGVAIDATTGLLYVYPGATSGVYVISYSQGGVVDRVGVAVYR